MSDPATRRAALAALTNGQGITAVNPPILLPANPYFDLAGEDFGRRLLLTNGSDGVEYCLRPDFTLPITTAYLESESAGLPEAFGYLGPIFRQRVSGPTEFDQAGLELFAQKDPDAALDRVLAFALSALDTYGIRPSVRLGSVALFEALLAAADMPDVWRSRIRHRFGHPEAMARLLDRLADPHSATAGSLPWKREELLGVVADQMVNAGLSLTGSRSPEEIAERYYEKQALAAARVPSETITLLQNYLSVAADARTALISIEGLAEDQGIDISEPLARLMTHFETLEAAENVGEISFEGGFSPRLDYYTGIVFEMKGHNGTLVSGGEYDRMLERLGASRRITASGCAVWVDRLEAETRL